MKVHFSWYGDLTEKNQLAATAGPIAYAKKYPDIEYKFYCQQSQIENFREKFKDSPSIEVISIEDQFEAFAKMNPYNASLVYAVNLVLKEVDEKNYYKNLGKEFSQAVVLALYGGYHLDTTIVPRSDGCDIGFPEYDNALQCGPRPDVVDVWATYMPSSKDTDVYSKACQVFIR